MVSNSVITPRPYLITGDTGFVGSRLRRHLLSQGFRVIGLHRRESKMQSQRNYASLRIDLSDRQMVEKHASVFRSARAVIHLAGRIPASYDESMEMHINANLRATENVLNVLNGSEVPVVLASTMYVYGLEPGNLPVGEDQLPRPVSPYGVSKLLAEHAAEHMARAGRVNTIALRFPGIFGVGSDVAIQLYASKALSGEPVSVYGGGTVIRDYVFVDDVVDACLLAEKKASDTAWGVYHIGSGESLSLLNLAKLAVDAAGGGILETNERPGPMDFAFDIARARAELGYSPGPLPQRIHQYVDELRQVSRLKRKQA